MLDGTLTFAWTAENVDVLRERYAAGASSGQIATALGNGCTRNAVIGKIHRLGLVRDSNPAPGAPRLDGVSRATRQAPARKVVAAPARKAVAEAPKPKPLPAIPPPPRPVYEPASGVELLSLKPHHCRWTDCTAAPWLFCGAVKAEGEPAFCAEHARRAYAKPAASASKVVLR